MTTDALVQLSADLQRLRNAAGRDRVFGAEQHLLQLNPPLTQRDIEQFERSHRVRLPSDYREFLEAVGNGGVGPYYGIFRLGEMDDSHGLGPWDPDFVGVLSEAFPHREAWNDLSMYPGDEADGVDFDRRRDAFEKEYRRSSHMNGAIPICHKGCALRNWLVVTGPEAGHVWVDHRAELKGIFPLTSPTKQRSTFLEWYRDWLIEALRAAR